MSFYLGMDVGGSRSRWAWLDSGLDLEHDLEIAEIGEKPTGIQAAIRGTVEAAESVARLFGEIRSAHPERSPEMAVIGMAGAGESTTAEKIEVELRRLGVSWPLRIVGDLTVAASAALTNGPGVAVWSGTGSFAVSRDAAGKLHRVGGRGYLLGDSGSAYDMVRCAGVAAMRSMDGLGLQTGLLEALVTATSAPSPSQLGPVMQRWSPERVAGCFPAVLNSANEGDEVAVGVLRSGANHLARLALGAAQRSGLEPRTVQLFLGGGVLENHGGVLENHGGVLENHRLFGDLLRGELEGVGLQRQPIITEGGAARGGAMLARALHLREEPMCSWVEARGTS